MENKQTYKLVGVAFLEESKEAAGLSKGHLKVPKVINSLGGATAGLGHDCFLKGICTMLDVTATAYHWMQMQRYHWFDIVSSESKMHCISTMEIADRCTSVVIPQTIELVECLIRDYNAGLCQLEVVLDNLPQGFLLKARVVTNYLQLKTMVAQRKHHKLEAWSKEFMEFCKELPEFMELTQKNSTL